MPAKVFVTGANGRVGRELVATLVAAGHPVTGLARDDAKAATVRALGAECIVGELADSAALAAGADGARVIYHLAGGIRGPGRTTPDAINHQGTRQLIAALADRPIDALVFTSTCAVYGDRSGLWVAEDMSAHPNTRYGQSKADAEAALLDAGLPLRIVRLAAVYGPGFPFMLVDLIQGGRAWLPGEGRNFVPTIHVDDAVAGLVRIAEAGQDGEIYNLADPNPVDLRTFYAAVHRAVGGRPVRFWSTWIPSYLQFWAARNNERLQSRTGQRPQFTPDNLRLFTASVRMHVKRMEKELEFTWRHPDPVAGISHTLDGGPSTA